MLQPTHEKMTDKVLRQQLCYAHQMLASNGLVQWTMGNISWRTGVDEVYIKPSGMMYSQLLGQRMVKVNMKGEPYPGETLKPSTDVFAHCEVYRLLPYIKAVAHTHSTYATAFAAARLEIPCVLTSIADEFGGPIPCAPYVRIGNADIGRAIHDTLGDRKCSAVLLGSHGVFTFGDNPVQAVKAAVMVEDAAKTVLLAYHVNDMLGGATPPRIPPLPEEEIRVAHERYKTAYGQHQ